MTTPDTLELVRTVATGGGGAGVMLILAKVWQLATIVTRGQAQVETNQIAIRTLAERLDEALERITRIMEDHEERIRENSMNIVREQARNDHRRLE